MKIYLAARYSRIEELNVYAQELRDMGYEVTSRWLLGRPPDTCGGPRGRNSVGLSARRGRGLCQGRRQRPDNRGRGGLLH